jgi:hypothetical protein
VACLDLVIPIVAGAKSREMLEWRSGLPTLTFWLRLPPTPPSNAAFAPASSPGALPAEGRTLSYLSIGLGGIGQPQEGLQVLEEGFVSVAKTGEQIAGPELHHVKGRLVLAQNPSDLAEAERCFRTAIEIAGGKVRDHRMPGGFEPSRLFRMGRGAVAHHPGDRGWPIARIPRSTLAVAVMSSFKLCSQREKSPWAFLSSASGSLYVSV